MIDVGYTLYAKDLWEGREGLHCGVIGVAVMANRVQSDGKGFSTEG